MATRDLSFSLNLRKPVAVVLSLLVLGGVAYVASKRHPDLFGNVWSLTGGFTIPDAIIRKEVGGTLPVYIKGDLIRHAMAQPPELRREMLAALAADPVLRSASAEPQSYYRNASAFWMADKERDIVIHAVFTFGSWTSRADFKASISRAGSWTVYNTTQVETTETEAGTQGH